MLPLEEMLTARGGRGEMLLTRFGEFTHVKGED